jgi:hypothetical protein
MTEPPTDNQSRLRPRYVAVIGAAGGLGQGILTVCREEGIGFTAIVRSRPERISDVPSGCRVAVVTSLADRSALTAAFAGADAVLTALGVTTTSQDPSALLSANMDTVEQAMLDAGVDRIVVINTLLTIAGSEVAVLFVELKDRLTKVSLRSRTDFDVREIAAQFGGGGHRAAAGIAFAGTMDEAKAAVLDALESALG